MPLPPRPLPFPLALLRLLTLAGLLLAGVVPAPAAGAPSRPPEGRRDFDIPAGEILDALKQFAKQSGEQLIYRVDLLEGLKTSAVRGRYTPREALGRMLGQTSLVVTRDDRTGALAIRPAADVRGAASSASDPDAKKKSPPP